MYSNPVCADTIEWLTANYPIKVDPDETTRCLGARNEYPLLPTEVVNAKTERKFYKSYANF